MSDSSRDLEPDDDVLTGVEPTGDHDSVPDDQGPGWLPALMAATLLLGIVGFVACGGAAWLLFQKRTELVIRTLEQTYIPEVEQSRLGREEKLAVVKQLRDFTMDLKRGRYEQWQAAAVMQRLVRLPVLQWGDLDAVESFAAADQTESESALDPNSPALDREAAIKHISRLRRAIELDQATAVDLEEDVLQPVLKPDRTPLGRSLIEPLDPGLVRQVVRRAKLVADRSDVPDQRFENVRLSDIVRRQIDAGLTEGSY